MKIAVTGAKGKVGQALIGQLDPEKYSIEALDLPECDASDLEALTLATKGSDVIFHSAWAALSDNYTSGTIDPINTKMIFNAYEAARRNKIPLVIMASSNHAHRHELRDNEGKITPFIDPPVPDSPYGAEKVFMEALGRYYASEHDMRVLCIRIGNINTEDKPKPDTPTRWMSHRDFGRLITLAIQKDFEPGHFEVVYGVSRQPVFDWVNSFGYEPQDGN